MYVPLTATQKSIDPRNRCGSFELKRDEEFVRNSTTYDTMLKRLEDLFYWFVNKNKSCIITHRH
jgi:hypothetical protein